MSPPALVSRNACTLAGNPIDRITLGYSVITQGYHMPRYSWADPPVFRGKSMQGTNETEQDKNEHFAHSVAP